MHTWNMDIRIMLALATASSVGCSASDTGGTPDAGGPNLPADARPTADATPPPTPGVTVAFPPPLSLTDASAITIRGTASDQDGIAAIRVNGMLATTTSDFAAWQLEIALHPGENTLIVESEDALGNIDQAAAHLRVQVPRDDLRGTGAMVLDHPRDRLLILAGSAMGPSLWAVSLETGEATMISSAGRGSGEMWTTSVLLALDAARDRALIVDRVYRDAKVISVALDTGDRQVLSPADPAHGPEVQYPIDAALDAQRNRLLIIDRDTVDITAVDLTTGQRSYLTGPPGQDNGSTDVLDGPADLIMDEQNDRVLVLDEYRVDDGSDGEGPQRYELFAVDPLTGAVSPVPSPGVLKAVRDMVMDPTGDRIFVVRTIEAYEALDLLDLTTGERSIITDDSTGYGQWLRAPYTLVVDARRNRILVGDPGLAAIVAVDLTTGDRSIFRGRFIGEGHPMEGLRSVALDVRGQRAFLSMMADDLPSALLAVDLTRSNRTLLSGDQHGSGPSLFDPMSIALHANANRLLVVTDNDVAGSYLQAVDLATGNRTTFATNTNAPTAIAADEASNRAYITEGLGPTGGSLHAIDLATEERALVSDMARGMPGQVHAIAVAPQAQRALVGTYSSIALVDMVTGQATPVADGSTGSGPIISYPQGVALSADGARAYIMGAVSASLGGEALIAVELSTGDRVELSGANAGRGPALSSSRHLALDNENEVIWYAPSSTGLGAIDLRTGDRVLVTR